MKKLALSLCIAFLATGLSAQDAPIPADEGGKVKNPPKELQLEYKFKVGEYRRYDMVIIGEGMVRLPGQTERSTFEARTEFTFAQHAKAFVPKDEIWRMEWDMIRGALTIPEFGEMTLTVPSLTFEMDKYGAISKMTGLDDLAVAPGLPKQDSMGKALGQLTSFGFPKKALKEGDTWEQEFKVEIPGQEPVQIKTTSRLAGFEVLEGSNCAKIVTTYETPFKLTETKPEPQGSSGAGGGKDQKPKSLSGTEKAEFCMHFAYDEGRIMRVSGTLSVTADLAGKEPVVTDEIALPKDIDPEKEAQIRAEQELAKHDVSIKYTMTSVYNPKMPESAVEKPE